MLYVRIWSWLSYYNCIFSPNIQLDFSAEQGIPWYEREMERTLENLSQQLSQTSVQENAKDDGSNDVYGISYDAEKEGKTNIIG